MGEREREGKREREREREKERKREREMLKWPELESNPVRGPQPVGLGVRG